MNDQDDARATLPAPKLSSVAAMVLSKIENSSHERNVRSAAKYTFGSTRIGTWIPGEKYQYYLPFMEMV